MDKKVIVITGASGTGKTTISRYLEEKYQIPHIVTHTTRAPRAGEIDGEDYYFETETSFSTNHYLEQVNYSGNRYGSSEEGLQKAWEKSDLVSIVVDTKGAIAYRQKYGASAVIIFLEVDPDAVAERLRKRGDDVKRLKARLHSDENQRDFEMPKELLGNYYKIVNKDINFTKEMVDNIISDLKK